MMHNCAAPSLQAMPAKHRSRIFSMSKIVLLSQGAIQPRRVDLEQFTSSTTSGSVYAYLGIPFAQPPIGDLRWKLPQGPLPSWEGIRQSHWGPTPRQLQSPSIFRPRDGNGVPLDEDTLYLNVWVPADRDAQARQKPVLVWIYGGSFVTGSTSTPAYDGARLAHESDCIVISVSYRVGILGFAGSRSLAAEANPHSLPRRAWDAGMAAQDPSSSSAFTTTGTGNYGLWDIAAALEWVQDSISLFGGDPEAVTLFGESAGAIAIDYLLHSPRVPKGLFARAILQSGVLRTVLPRSLASAQASFDALRTEFAPKAASDEEALTLLRATDAEQMMQFLERFPANRPRTEYDVSDAAASSGRPELRSSQPGEEPKLDPLGVFGPVWDGVMVPDDVRERTTNARYANDGVRPNNGHAGVMLGHNVDEGTLFNVEINKVNLLETHVSKFHPKVAPLVRDLYGTASVLDNSTAYTVCAAYTGDALFHSPVKDAMRALASNAEAPDAYGYIFGHRPSVSLLYGFTTAPELFGSFGSFHVSEIPFVFGFDGVESYPFASSAEEYGVDVSAPIATLPPHARPVTMDTDEPLGFTPRERDLSLLIMRKWASFAHGEHPWAPLRQGVAGTRGDTGDLDLANLTILSIADHPPLGSKTPVALVATRKAKGAAKTGDKIEVRMRRIGELLSWTQGVGFDGEKGSAAPQGADTKRGPPPQPKGYGTPRERHGVWTDAEARNMWLNHYGDADFKWEG